MKWIFVVFTIYSTCAAASRQGPTTINRIISIIQRRHNPILGVPEYPEELPEAEPIMPGHTLIRPARGMLKSAVKFPHKDFGNTAVYGNLDNLGLTSDQTNQRIMYTDFRKANNLLTKLLNTIHKKRKKGYPSIIFIDFDNRKYEKKIQRINKNRIDSSDELNVDLQEQESRYGRRRSSKKTKFRDRNKQYNNDDSSSESDDSDQEKNPGNPYTIHKNKYKQNWLWNHEMDGDHMNVNPYAPEMNVLGPSGSELFFGRKWWYFNQDDYKPMG